MKKIMKKTMVAMMMFIISSSASAQNVKEPEYNGQVAILQADSSLVVLQKEVAQMYPKPQVLDTFPYQAAACLTRVSHFCRSKAMPHLIK